MQTFLTIVHIFICFFLIAVVLLQSGRAGGMGVLSGAATQTVFGGRGAGNFLQRVTAICAILFMVTSATLAWMSTSRRDRGLASAPSGGGSGSGSGNRGGGTSGSGSNSSTGSGSTGGSGSSSPSGSGNANGGGSANGTGSANANAPAGNAAPSGGGTNGSEGAGNAAPAPTGDGAAH